MDNRKVRLNLPIFVAKHNGRLQNDCSIYSCEFTYQMFPANLPMKSVLEFLNFYSKLEFPLGLKLPESVEMHDLKINDVINKIINKCEEETKNVQNDDLKKISALIPHLRELLNPLEEVVKYQGGQFPKLMSVDLGEDFTNINVIIEYLAGIMSLNLDDRVAELMPPSTLHFTMAYLLYLMLTYEAEFVVDPSEFPAAWALLTGSKKRVQEHCLIQLIFSLVFNLYETRVWVEERFSIALVRCVKLALQKCPEYVKGIRNGGKVDKDGKNKIESFVEQNNLQMYNLLPYTLFYGLSQHARVLTLIQNFVTTSKTTKVMNMEVKITYDNVLKMLKEVDENINKKIKNADRDVVEIIYDIDLLPMSFFEILSPSTSADFVMLVEREPEDAC